MLSRGFHPSGQTEKAAFVICLVLCAGLLALPDGAQIGIADSLAAVTTRPFFRLRDFVEDVGRVRREVGELRAQVAALEAERTEVARFRRDADELRAAAGLRAATVGTLQACEVVARRAGRLTNMLQIRSPVPVAWRLYQPVVSPAGLLGRVRQAVGAHEAWIELITSPELAVGCEIERTGVLGILRPREGGLGLEMVGRDEDVVVGDRVLTSGIAEIRDAGLGGSAPASFPRGLPVGVVREVSTPADQLFKVIHVDPLASFTRNSVVFVITAPGAWYLPALAPAGADTVPSAGGPNGPATGEPRATEPFAVPAPQRPGKAGG